MAATSNIAPTVHTEGGSAPHSVEHIFYDGHCGLCQGFIRFTIARDRAGAKFHYAPLQGKTFEALVPADRRASLPDSFVILTNDGRLLIRSDGTIHVLRRLGGFWNFVAGVISIFPRALRNAVYDFVARIRYRVFGRRDNVCPVAPPELLARFDD